MKTGPRHSLVFGWLVLAVTTFDDDPKVAEQIDVSPAR